MEPDDVVINTIKIMSRLFEHGHDIIRVDIHAIDKTAMHLIDRDIMDINRAENCVDVWSLSTHLIPSVPREKPVMDHCAQPFNSHVVQHTLSAYLKHEMDDNIKVVVNVLCGKQPPVNTDPLFGMGGITYGTSNTTA